MKSVFGRALSVSIRRRDLWLDELSGVSGATREEVRKLLADAEQGGIFESNLVSQAESEESDQPQLEVGDCLLDQVAFQLVCFQGRVEGVFGELRQ